MKTVKFAFLFAAVLAMVACEPKQPTTCPECGEDPCVCDVEDTEDEYPISLTDASADDWANLPAEYVFETKCAEGASKDALKSVKVFADELYINLLVEWDPEILTDTLMPFHVYLNVDGAAETGGYGDQWLEPFDIDVLMEGFFFSGGEAVPYEPGMFAYGGAYNTNEWNWSELVAAAPFYATQHVKNGVVEIQLTHSLIPASWGTEFTVGFDIQGADWNSVGVLPNAPDDELGNVVKADKMSVTFYSAE